MKDQIYRNVLLLVGELHKRGYERLRISPGMSASGAYWRCSITHVGNISRFNGAMIADFYADVALYTSGQEGAYFGWEDAAHDTVAELAEKFIERFPEICAKGKGPDPAYAAWYEELLGITGPNRFPISYSDGDLPSDCLTLTSYHREDLGMIPNIYIRLPPPGEADDVCS